MKVRVLFFAELKELFGDHRWVEMPDGLSVGEAALRLTGSSDKWMPEKRSLVYAVNENFENSDKKLQDGDCLAIMTPMSGG